MKLYVSLILLAALTISCANRQRVTFNNRNASASNEKKEGKGVTLTLEWLKNKENSVDLMAVMTNNYEKSVRIKKSAIKLSVGGQQGYLSSSDFSGELAGNGGTERGLLIFKFNGEVSKTGFATILISEITSENGKEYPDLMLSVPAVNNSNENCNPRCEN